MSYRSPYAQASILARLYSSFGQQRKLFLLVFLWTCMCLVIFRTSLFATNTKLSFSEEQTSQLFEGEISPSASANVEPKLFARAAGLSSVAPEFALPDNNAIYYSLSSDSAKPKAPPAAAVAQPKHSQTVSSDTKRSSARRNEIDSSQRKPIKQDEPPVAGSQCAYDYPSLFDLQFNNIHWQKFNYQTGHAEGDGSNNSDKNQNSTSSATYYLYNAYYDDRWRGGTPSIRILAMIDRISPPPTNCLMWSPKITASSSAQTTTTTSDAKRLVPLISRASFVYAWYPKWGNYKDGLLQPWIITCPIPRQHIGLVPDSVSLIAVPSEVVTIVEPTGNATIGQTSTWEGDDDNADEARNKRDLNDGQPVSIAMPPSFSSSSSPSTARTKQQTTAEAIGSTRTFEAKVAERVQFDCEALGPITNNLPVYNQRPKVKGKFAVCVKGLDFPHEDVSIRLIEWIELLNLLGAGKIFLYNLDVHENISKVLNYYQKRGIVELSPLTLPGDQPNLPEYQHLYLKNRLTSKRQNELIPYNDCLYRNLNSYQYLALLDIDEIIMPMKESQFNWHDLMEEVEKRSLSEQNYSRASYNVRNVYFFDDLAGPLGTTSASDDEESDEPSGRQARDSIEHDGNSERGIPKYLHMMQHVYRSKNYTKPGQYVKCFHNTERVVSLHNHFPMNCFGQCTTYSIPVELAHLQHYRKDCVGPLKQSCKNDYRAFTTRDTTIWKYKQQMIKRTTRVLSHLGLLGGSSNG